MPDAYRICARCVMDTTDPDIRFDQHGFCNHCTDYIRHAANHIVPGAEGRERLGRLVEAVRARARGRDYDCVIGVSGGVDSTFVAYVVKELGLRPLAVHLDNGWNSSLAVTNIQRTLDRLEIDLYTRVLDWPEFKDLQLAFLRASTPDAEVPTDHAIAAVLLQVAAENGIDHIFAGSNFATEAILPAAWSRGVRDWKYIRSVHRRFGTVPLRSYPHFSLLDFVWARSARGIRFVYPLNYVDYVKADAMKVLQDELGWSSYGGKHHESIYTRFFQAFILPRKFGFDKRRAHLSTLICSGQTTREEALAELERDPCPPDLLEQDREFLVKKLGLSDAEFDAILSAPPRVFWDYPSYERGLVSGPALRLYRARHNRPRPRSVPKPAVARQASQPGPT